MPTVRAFTKDQDGAESHMIDVGKRKTEGLAFIRGLFDKASKADGSLGDELNRLSNKCLRAILRERDADLVDVMFEVDEIAEKWRRDEAMSEDAIRYASVLYGFLNHEYDARVLDAFESSDYRGSITRLYSLLEDSGWKLVQHGRDQPQDFVDDELLQPPPSFNKY